MLIFSSNIHRGVFGAIAVGALGCLAAATIVVPTATAQPQCTAANLTTTIGKVAADTGGFLGTHADANQAVTNSGSQADSETALRTYFVAHQDQWAELQRIARPLATLRQQCQVNVAPAQIARLFDAMAA
ncbi:hemophore-related protein [Mycobacterium sp.]|uniref:hemophore-related protein n=1 Tax=Mycobacterium sp. TaxID=1785 RepID=UPI002D5D2AFC|nr:hemophore-related protein [Mycobacterium sp.]HZA11898.1 hemophore-related protein [Mycobacterium sp.]